MKDNTVEINISQLGQDSEWIVMTRQEFDKLVTAPIELGGKVNKITHFKDEEIPDNLC